MFSWRSAASFSFEHSKNLFSVFFYLSNIVESSLEGFKTLWEKDKLPITNNFSFSHCFQKTCSGKHRKSRTVTEYEQMLQQHYSNFTKSFRHLRGPEPGEGDTLNLRFGNLHYMINVCAKSSYTGTYN